MNILVRCNGCEKTFRVDMRLARSVILCPHCHQDVGVPKVFRVRNVKCACGTVLEVPIEDANFAVGCPHCSRSRPAVGLDTFLDQTAPSFVSQKTGSRLLGVGKTVTHSKEEEIAEAAELKLAQNRREEEARLAVEAATRREEEPATQPVGPGTWALFMLHMGRLKRWCAASWMHAAIATHAALIFVLFLSVSVLHTVIAAYRHNELFGPDFRQIQLTCLWVSGFLVLLGLVWMLVLGFLEKAFENKALAADARRRRTNYPHLKMYLDIVQSLISLVLYLGLILAVLSELGSVILAFEQPKMAASSFIGTAIGIFGVVFLYVIGMAAVELVLVLVDIERNTSRMPSSGAEAQAPRTPPESQGVPPPR